MKQVRPIFKREFAGYFRTPVAYVFLLAFLVTSVALAFSRFGGFFQAGVASLETYFGFYPWLFLVLVPAVGMRLWSEEKRSGTAELLFTLPVTTLEAVIGKFLGAWAFLTLAILLSFPMALTIGYLGSPDWGVVASSYLGAILMAGGYLGVCSLTSALTKNQIVAAIISLVMILALFFAGLLQYIFMDTTGAMQDVFGYFSAVEHMETFSKGIIDSRPIVWYLSMTTFMLVLTYHVFQTRKWKM